MEVAPILRIIGKKYPALLRGIFKNFRNVLKTVLLCSSISLGTPKCSPRFPGWETLLWVVNHLRSVMCPILGLIFIKKVQK
jgi:hypothetical protein